MNYLSKCSSDYRNSFAGAIILVLLTLILLKAIEYTEARYHDNNIGKLESVDLNGYTGNIIGVKSISKYITPHGLITGYTVDIDSTYLGKTVSLKVVFDENGMKIKDLLILEIKSNSFVHDDNTETVIPINLTDYAVQFHGVFLPVYLSEHINESDARPYDSILLHNPADGMYSSEDLDYDRHGFKNTVALEITDHKIGSIYWNSINMDGIPLALTLEMQSDKDKVVLPLEEQLTILFQHIMDYQAFEHISLDDEGVPVHLPGVTIDITSFVALLKECTKQIIHVEDVNDIIPTIGSQISYLEDETDVSVAIVKGINQSANFLHEYVIVKRTLE